VPYRDLSQSVFIFVRLHLANVVRLSTELGSARSAGAYGCSRTFFFTEIFYEDVGGIDYVSMHTYRLLFILLNHAGLHISPHNITSVDCGDVSNSRGLYVHVHILKRISLLLPKSNTHGLRTTFNPEANAKKVTIASSATKYV
jgi:hypothetical protein